MAAPLPFIASVCYTCDIVLALFDLKCLVKGDSMLVKEGSVYSQNKYSAGVLLHCCPVKEFSLPLTCLMGDLVVVANRSRKLLFL